MITRVVKILCQKIANSAHITCKFCSHFLADFPTIKLSVALLYDPVCHTSILAYFYLVCSFVICAFLLCFFYFLVLFYFIAFTPKWFAGPN